MNQPWWSYIAEFILLLLVLLFIFDTLQRKHSISRNFPIIGRLRFILEGIGPELRQYIVTDNNSEKPFARDERRWIYASSKGENSYFGFGTDNDLDNTNNYIIIKQSSFPYIPTIDTKLGIEPNWEMPCAKTLGGYRGRKKAFVPNSIVNVSGMSYGALGPNAVKALNKGVALAGCMQSTGEGSISPYHNNGGDLIWQIGTGYFGARNEDGTFSYDKFLETVEKNPSLKAIEIKISQGAKPGLGGLLPGEKVTKEISEIRGIKQGVDCHSPAGHTAFNDADSLLDFVEKLAHGSGLPVGIKSAVGDTSFFVELAEQMSADAARGVDFIIVDGGEGGTGAAPLFFTDNVSLPFMTGFERVMDIFKQHSLEKNIVFVGSGRLGLPDRAFRAFAMGADMVNVAREAMLSIGCIQAQRCHTGRCPTGVATSNAWLNRGLDPEIKSVRASKYLIELRKQITLLTYACGVSHPSMVNQNMIEVINAS